MYVNKAHKQRFVSAPLRALLFATSLPARVKPFGVLEGGSLDAFRGLASPPSTMHLTARPRHLRLPGGWPGYHSRIGV